MSSWKFPCFKPPFLFSARRSRVKRVRKSLESSLLARIELIESYAKVGFQNNKNKLLIFMTFSPYSWVFLQISSMIEIEVEMDTDVLAAEAVGNAVSIK